jgi:hypothetical protein
VSVPTDNENWIIDAGDVVIRRKAGEGLAHLTSRDRLIYCLWVADYSMRNAGELGSAEDLYPQFHAEGADLARQLSLPLTEDAFSLPREILEREYFARFEQVCNEVRRAALTHGGAQ